MKLQWMPASQHDSEWRVFAQRCVVCVCYSFVSGCVWHTYHIPSLSRSAILTFPAHACFYSQKCFNNIPFFSPGRNGQSWWLPPQSDRLSKPLLLVRALLRQKHCGEGGDENVWLRWWWYIIGYCQTRNLLFIIPRSKWGTDWPSNMTSPPKWSNCYQWLSTKANPSSRVPCILSRYLTLNWKKSKRIVIMLQFFDVLYHSRWV